MLTGRGLIASITKAPPGQRAFAVVTCTDKVGHGGWSVSAHVGDTKTCLHAATKLSTPHCTLRITAPVTTALPCQGAAFLRSQEPLVLQLSGELAQQVGRRGANSLPACHIHGALSLCMWLRFAVLHSSICLVGRPPSHPSPCCTGEGGAGGS